MPSSPGQGPSNKIIYEGSQTTNTKKVILVPFISSAKSRSFDWGTTTLINGINNFELKTREVILAKIEEFAHKMVVYAQYNAPWSDISGDARAGLDSLTEVGLNQFVLSLFHGVDYGIFLEVAWGARWAIIIPTIETLGPELMRDLTGIMGGIKYYV